MATTVEGHVDAIVDAIVKSLSGPTRRWNPWSIGTVKGELRDRLGAAARGELEPVDEVKSLRGGHDHLYEIRWLHINVTDQDEAGKLQHTVTGARLIHVEPPAHADILVGLLAHEKPNEEDVGNVQDAHIDDAIRILDGGRSSTWGISIRPSS